MIWTGSAQALNDCIAATPTATADRPASFKLPASKTIAGMWKNARALNLSFVKLHLLSITSNLENLSASSDLTSLFTRRQFELSYNEGYS